MTTEIRVPQLPESVADATLVAWHKRTGDRIERDENLASLETDKVVLEVPAPANGIVKEIKVESGTVVTSGQLLAIIEESVAGAGRAAAATAAQSPPPPTQTKDEPAGRARGATKLAAPSTKRLVEENHLDPAAIPASGKNGRLTKSDVLGFLKTGGQPAPGPAPVPAQAPPSSVPARAEHHVPMTRLRQRVAERLVEAQSTQALLTSFNEVDLAEVQALRARYKDRFEKEHGAKLGFMSFFVKAAVEALKKYPIVNASVDEHDIVYHDYYDIGVAVSTERGLMVPIVRDADSKSFAAIEKEIADYARKARDGSIAIEDLTGGTFTITNGGVFGSLMSTPIVNAPQSAILGMHKIQERPMVVGGQIAIRPMMYLAVTYDHRIIDGREAVLFLVAVKEALEDPGRMLLGI
jgi:2-oxoglutarate dehydrogenase E2 component (dihydrolipoamide succinyltransferase)